MRTPALLQLLCDDHQDDPTVFTLVGPDLRSRDVTYGELQVQSERFAGALVELGVKAGDEVATLMA